MPAVLVEMGYLSNTSERNRLSDDAYQSLLAETIAEGLTFDPIFNTIEERKE
jgi:N-acetylmuramoyl-L-alanine amidase